MFLTYGKTDTKLVIVGIYSKSDKETAKEFMKCFDNL